MKELLFVCIGSFFGGVARYLVGKAVQSWVIVSFPWGTMAVNVIGCSLIGLLSGLSLGGHITPTTKLVLVTGFCGGFTTFSTFMNENLLLYEGLVIVNNLVNHKPILLNYVVLTGQS